MFASASPLVPPSYLPYLANAVAAFTLIPITIGLVSMINPAAAIKNSEFSEPKADQQLVRGLTRLYGSRCLAIGISTLALWYSTRLGLTSYSTLGACFLTFAFFVTVDGWVIGDVVGKGQWGHWKFVPVLAALALGLMGLI